MLNSLRNRYRQSLEKRTASLDPQTRSDLARDVHRATIVGVDELQEVNTSIEQAQLALHELEEKKRFVGVRLVAYQEKLEQRAQHLKRQRERLTGETLACENEIQVQHNGSVREETQFLVDSVRGDRSPGVIATGDEFEEQDGQDDERNDSGDEESGLAILSIDELQRQQSQLQRDQQALGKVEKSHAGMDTNARELQKKIFVLERKRDEILQKTGECRDFLVAAAAQETEDGDTVQSQEEEGQFEGEDDSAENGELVILVSENTEELCIWREGNSEEDEKDK